MRMFICLGMLASSALAADPPLPQVPAAPHTTAHVSAACPHCQGGASNPLPTYSQRGCRVNICQQAAEAGLSLTCCEPDARRSLELWADYCQEKQAHGGLACGTCGVHGATCQIRNWGRGCTGRGCGLLSGHAHLLRRAKPLTDCTTATCDAGGHAVDQPTVDADEPADDSTDRWESYSAPEPPPAPVTDSARRHPHQPSTVSPAPTYWKEGRAARLNHPTTTSTLGTAWTSGWDRLKGSFSSR